MEPASSHEARERRVCGAQIEQCGPHPAAGAFPSL